MSDLYDRELADTVAEERARRARRNKSGAEPGSAGSPDRGERLLGGRESAPVDRSSPRWQRLRGALCEHHGLGLLASLDEYADRVWLSIRNTTAPAASHADASAAGAEGGKP